MEKREHRYASLKNQTQNLVIRTKRRSKKAALAISAAVGVVGAISSHSAQGAIIPKSNNLTNLNQTGSWQTGAVPGSGDVANFGNALAGSTAYSTAGTLVLGGSLSWGGIQVTTPGVPVIIGADGNSLTIGASGIDMTSATQNLTLNVPISFTGGNETWNVNGGRTLTIGGSDSDSSTTNNFLGTGTILINGTIGGTGQFNQTQAGSVLDIANSNALNGVIYNITGGQLEFTNEPGGITLTSAVMAALSGSTNIVLTNTSSPAQGVTLNVGSMNAVTTYSGILSGGGGLNLSGTGSLTLLGQNTYAGATTISGNATLFIGNGGTNGSLGTNAGAIADSGTLFFDVAKNVTLANVVSGTGGISTDLQGSYTLDLTATNTYNGVTAFTAVGDNIYLGSALALQNSLLNYNNGSLSFGAQTTATIGGLTGGAASAGIGLPAGFTLNLGTSLSSAQVNTYLGSLGGGSATAVLNITNQAGGGTVLAGTNTFAAAVNIKANVGYLQFGNGGANGWTTNLVGEITDNGTLDFDLNAPITVNNAITGTDGGTNPGSNLTISSSANVTLTNSNTFNGVTIITGGGNSGLVLGNSLALESSLLNYNNQGGTLNFGSQTAATLGGLEGAEALNLNNSASNAAVTLSFGLFNQPETYSGALTGTGTIIKQGTANEVFSGLSSYTGGTTILTGELDISNGSALGNPGGVTTGNSFVTVGGTSGGATLATTASITTPHGLIISGPNNAIYVNTGSTLEVDGALTTINGSGTNSLFLQNGTLELTSTNAASGFTNPIVIENTGILFVGNGTTGSLGSLGAIPAGTVGSDAGTLVFDLPSSAGTFPVTNVYQGAGGFAQNGAGTTLVLSGTNSVTGATTINNGILALGANPNGSNQGPLGNGASNGTLTVNAAGTLNLNGYNATVGGLSGAGTILNTGSGTNLFTPITLTVGNNQNASTTFSGNILATGGGGPISLVFNPTASGTLNLTGTNSYTGTTTINTGVVQATWFNNTQALGPGSYPSGSPLGNATNIGNLGNTSGLTLGAATLEILANTNGFSLGTTPVALQSTSSAFQIDTGSTTFEIDGLISNGSSVGQLVKTGPGTLIITAPTNTFTGGIYVIRGNLQVGNGTTGTFSTLGSGLITDNGTITFDLPGANSNYFLTTTIGGTGGVTQSGPGTLTLSTVATYTGDTVLSSGTILIANPLALQGSALDDNTGGGTLSFGTQTAVVLGGLNGNASLPLLNASSAPITLIVGTNNRNSAFTGNLTDSGAGSVLEKIGTASFTLSGVNSLAGQTLVNEGLLEFTTGTAIPSAAANSILVNPGGAVALDTGVTSLASLGVVSTSSTGALALSSVNAATALNFTSGVLAPYANMSVGAATGGLTYTGTITPAGGVYKLGGGSLLTLPSTNQLTSTNSVLIENGAVAVTGVNNYSGGTSLAGTYASIPSYLTGSSITPYVDATLDVTTLSNGGLPSGLGESTNAAANLSINGGNLVYVGAAASTDRLLTIGSGGATLTSSGSGPITFTNTGAIVSASTAPEAGALGTTTVSGINTAGLAVGMSISDLAGDIPGGTTISAITLNSITLSQTATADASDTFTFGNQNRNLVLNGTSPNNVFDGALSNPSNGQLSVIESQGEWTLGGTNTYSGNTYLNSGGELGFSSSSAVSPNSTLQFNGGILQASGPFTSFTGVAFNSNTFNGGFDVVSSNATFSVPQNLGGGLSSDTGGLVKIGAGTLALTGSESYTGVTTISNGTLNLNFAGAGAPTSNILGASTSPVTISSATLLMTGTASTTSEQLKSTALAAGPTTFSVQDGGGLTTLNLGLIAPSVGATATVLLGSTNSTLALGSVLSANGGGTTQGLATLTGSSVTSNLLITPAGVPYMIIGTNWAAASSNNISAPGNVVPFQAYTIPTLGTGGLSYSGDVLSVTLAGETRNGNGPDTDFGIRFDSPTAALYAGGSGGAGYPVFNASTGQLNLLTSGTSVDQVYSSSSSNAREVGMGSFMMTPNMGAATLMAIGAGQEWGNMYISSDEGGGLAAEEGYTNYTSTSSAAGNEVVFWALDTLASMYDIVGIYNRSQNNTSVVKDGPGTLYMMNTAQGYAGSTYVNGGVMAFNDNRELGGGGTFLGGATNLATPYSNPVILDGGTLEAIPTSTGVTNIVLDSSNVGGTADRAIQLGSAGGGLAATSGSNLSVTLTVDGVVSGPGALSISGGGIVKLTGNNTYTGGTNINGGTLQIDNANGLATGTGAVTINNTGTVDGVGTINTSVVINSGGTLTPGDPLIANGVGTITVGSLNINTGGKVQFAELGGVSSQSVVDVLGGLNTNFGSQIEAYVEGTTLPLNSNGTYNLFTVTGQTSGITSGLTLGDDLTASVSFGTSFNAVSGVTTVQMFLTNGSVSGIWGVGTGGTWGNSGNWAGGTVPNGSGAFAIFSNSQSPGLSGPVTVSLGGSSWTEGALIFNNTNSYTLAQATPGDGTSITLNEGTNSALVQDTLGSHTISAPIILASNARFSVLTPNATDQLVISGAISGATESVDIHGTGTTVFAGNNTYGGGTTIDSPATLQLGAGGTTGNTGTGPLTDNSTLAFDFSNHPTYATVISGSGGIVMNSPTNGGVILTAANTYSGSTVINSGILSAGNTNSFAGSTGIGNAVTVNSPGILDVNGITGVTIGTIAGNGTIDNVSNGGQPTLVLGASGFNDQFNGIIEDTTGTLSLYKIGSGNTTLNNANTYTGSTDITAGAIVADATNAIPAVSPTYFNSLGGALNLIMGDNVTISSPITLGGSTAESGEFMDYPGSLDTDLASNMILLGGGGQYRLGITGTGTLWLTGTSAFNSGQYCFITKGAVAYAGNGGLLVPDATIGIGRSTGNAVALYFEGNAVGRGNGVSTGEGVSMLNMSMEIDNSADFEVTGGYDMENSTNATSSGTITLNGGTLGAAYFFQTQNPLSPGANSGAGQNLPTGVVNGTYMALNGGVLMQTAQVGTNAFLAQNLNNLDITIETGGALFDSNGFVMNVNVAMQDQFLLDGGVQKLGLGTLQLGGYNTTFQQTSNFIGPMLVKGGLLELVNYQGMGGIVGYTTSPNIAVSAGGAAGMEGGSITNTGTNNAVAFLAAMTYNTVASFGSLALDPADATDNISYTAAYAGAVSAGGTFGMNNTIFANMSIGALSSGVTYTGTITPSGGNYRLGGGGTLTLPNANALAGSNNVLYENGGTVQVVNTNSYSGTTTITGGYVMADPFFPTQPYQSTSLAVTALANGGSASSLGSSSNVATNLIIQGGTLEFIGANAGAASTDRLFTIGSAGATLNSSGTVPISFTNTGAEAEGADSGQSGITVTVGSAVINNVSTAGLTLGTVVSDALGAGDLPAGVSIVGLTPNSITVSAPATGNSHTDTLSFTNQLRALTLTGTNTGTNLIASQLNDASTGALSLVKSGAGTWQVSGTNTYTGGTIVNAGVLEISSNTNMGNVSGSATLNGGTLEALNSITTARNFFLGTGSPTINVASGTYEIDGTLANSNAASGATSTVSGVLNVSGTGTLVLTGSNTYSGGTVIAGGSTLTLGNGTDGTGSINGGVITDNGALDFNRTDSALIVLPQIAGTGAVNQIGTGTTTLNGGDTYLGRTTVSAGTLIIGQAGSLPTGNNVTNNSNLDINANSQAGTVNGTGTTVVASEVVLAANSFTQGTLNNSGNTLLSTINAGSGTIGTVSGVGTMSVGSGGSYSITGTANQTSLTNNGFTVLGGASTFTTVAGSGTLTVNSGLNVTNFNQTTLDLNGNMTLNANGIGTVGVINGAGSLTLGTDSFLQLAPVNATFGPTVGTVSNVKSITLSGSGATQATLDITNNSLVITYANNAGAFNPAIETSVRADIINGFDNYNWDGHGITSSIAEADAATGEPYGGNSAVGYADNNDIGDSTIGNNSVLVRFTYYGDADLNGVVNISDFDDWLYGYTGGTGSAGDVDWSVGDFAYTGHVTLTDFDLWLGSYTSGNGSLSTLDHAIDVSTLSSSQKTELLDIVASVPEPTSIGLIGMAAIGLMPRRRRKQK